MSKNKHGKNIHEHGKQQKNEPQKFAFNLSQRLVLRSSNKYVPLQNLSIYYTWENIRKQYKDNKLKIIALTWNDEFELLDGSYSVLHIQDYIEYIIKKHETLTTKPPTHVCNNRINKINNRLVFKIKDRYKLELQTPETIKLFGSTKKLIDKTKNGEKIPSLEVVEVVLIQCNLVDNQYQQKSEVLYIFAPYNSYAYLLNVESHNLVLLKTYNTEFHGIIITFTDQNGRTLEIEDKVNLTLLINK